MTRLTRDLAISGSRSHRAPLPGGSVEGVVLTLRTSTFVAKAVGLNDDPRELGIALDWVAVEEGGPNSQQK